MTLQEFKAWFDGFTENIGERPSAKQWERIQARVKEIDGAAVSYPVFVERYWPRYLPGLPYWQQPGWNTCQSFASNVKDDGHTVSFNSSQAMLALGKADYAAIQ